MFQLYMGIPWGAEADTESLRAMRNQLPAGANWVDLAWPARARRSVRALGQ